MLRRLRNSRNKKTPRANPWRLKTALAAVAGRGGGGGSPAGEKRCGLVLQRGLEEQTLAESLNLFCNPDERIDQQLGVAHRVQRGLALDFGHAGGVDTAYNR